MEKLSNIKCETGCPAWSQLYPEGFLGESDNRQCPVHQALYKEDGDCHGSGKSLQPVSILEYNKMVDVSVESFPRIHVSQTI